MFAGEVLDQKYRIVRLVGEGGMGAVYEAEHTFLGKHVAIKVLAADFAGDADAIRRFYREAQAAARIGHENICEVSDVGQTSAGLPYIVMQLLQGRTLSVTIAESAPLPVGRVVDIASQALEALGAAHAAGIVHRDMKPDNIFLTRVAGRDDFVKLLDFGISKVRVAGAKTKLTQDGTIMGTPQYMSPEQARGESDVDGRVDIWAVGVILFEMLTGRIPFDGENYNKILFHVLAAPIPGVRSLRPGISSEVEAVVLRAMERDLDRRFNTARELADALQSAWMGSAESGFAVRGTVSVPSAAADEATELAPAQMLVQVGRSAATGSPAAQGSGPQRKAVRTPTETGPTLPHMHVVGRPSSHATPAGSSGVSTAPQTRSPDGFRDGRPTSAVATPGATQALPTMAEPAKQRARRPLAIAPIVVPATILLASVVLLVVKFGGSDGDDGQSPESDVATVAVTDVAAPDSVERTPPPLLSPASVDAGVGLAVDAGSERPGEVAAIEPDVSIGADEGLSTVAVAYGGEPSEPVKLTSEAGTTVRDSGTRRPPAPPAPPPPPPPPPPPADATTGPPPGMGTLSVVTVPWTEVLIDGASVGRAPFRDRNVTAGPHRITFINEGQGIRHEERMVITEGRNTEIRRNAQQMGASVVSRPDAGAAVSADAGVPRDVGITIRRRDAR